MKNKIKYIASLLVLMVALCGCDDLLNVRPKSEVIDKQMFSTASKCEDAIYGIYAEMGSDKNLYGYSLSFKYPELMMGNFDAQQSDVMAYSIQRTWAEAKSVTTAEDIWIAGYRVISHINKALVHILPMPDDKFRYVKLYKGELLALRAYMHMEMARIFAVSFASDNTTAKTRGIPYVTHYGITVSAYASLDKVYENIIADLTKAEEYLGDDLSYVPAIRTNKADGFTSCRMLHLNLYAVQAMIARAYWTMGDLDNAETYALKVIDSKKFLLMRDAGEWNASENGTLNLQETLFGLYSKVFTYNFYRYHNYSSSTISLSKTYKDVYSVDQNGSDRRYGKWFNTTFDECIKHLNNIYSENAENPAYNGNSILGVSLIRVPEMYYIVAEANLTKNPTKAMQYLDYVVASRGLVTFETRGESAITADNIFNERRKEFYADGQDFYNMKRVRKDVVIAGIGTFSGISDNTYTMPIPASVEDNYRQ